MAAAFVTNLPAPPKIPPVDANGIMPQEWWKWFYDLWLRAGGSTGTSIYDTNTAFSATKGMVFASIEELRNELLKLIPSDNKAFFMQQLDAAFMNAAGSDTEIQYNTGGLLDASPNLTFDSGTNTLATDNITVDAADYTNGIVFNHGSIIYGPLNLNLDYPGGNRILFKTNTANRRTMLSVVPNGVPVGTADSSTGTGYLAYADDLSSIADARYSFFGNTPTATLIQSARNSTTLSLLPIIIKIGSGPNAITVSTTSDVTLYNNFSAPGLSTLGNISTPGYVLLSGTGTQQRIKGDFSSTVSAGIMVRSAITTTVVDGLTTLSLIPNGLSTNSSYELENTSGSLTDSAYFCMYNSSTAYGLKGKVRGAGTYLPLKIENGGIVGITVNAVADVSIGTASLSTTATTGFPYIPTCAGVPTGVPTGVTGYAPLVIDSTNNKMYFYSGAAWNALN
jgi:hypothetical protein